MTTPPAAILPSLGLPPIALLPMTDSIMLDAARDIALLGGEFLAMGASPLMVLAVPSDGWSGAVPMMLWDGRLTAAPTIAEALCTNPDVAPALDALCLASDALFTRLREWRWLGAEDGTFCAITDGTGIAIVAGPAAASDVVDLGWLLAVAQVDGGASTILPLADDGVWALLAEAANLTLQ